MMDDNNNMFNEDDVANKDDKWDFADYAFTITGIIVGMLLVAPEILYSLFGIRIFGGSLSDAFPILEEGVAYSSGTSGWTLNQLRALSPMLFLLTTAIVYVKDAIDARRTGGYRGSMFTHTFESLFEEAIYMVITTIMVYSAILRGTMYSSWLAGPITWILFVFIFPLVRKKDNNIEIPDEYSNSDLTVYSKLPWLLLLIFIVGIIAEVITRAWVAFPLAWLVISIFKLVETIREKDDTIDSVFNIIYYVFSVILMAVGLIMNVWVTSWAAFPAALIICWILSKFGRFKKPVQSD